jgi:hypothetical protein
MNLAEFERGLDAWGSELAEWPAPQRAAAETLLAQSASARTLLAQHRSFELLFAPADMPPAPPAAVLLAGALSQRRPSSGILTLLQRNWVALAWPHAVGLAACLVAGFVIGAHDLPGGGAPSYHVLDLIDGTGPADE